MGKLSKNESELKSKIFNTFSEYQSEPSHDRRKVIFARFHELIIEWCDGYLYNFINAELQVKEYHLFLVEIYDATARLVQNKETVPKEENLFLVYLRTTLSNAKNEYYRKYG
jgi:hypothetical protein